MKIAFIVSMKYGLTQFMWRDINALVEKGHELHLFTLLNQPGLYNPLPAWKVTPIRWWTLLVAHLLLLLQRPLLYYQLAATAFHTHSLRDFAIAVQFAAEMRTKEVIYAYFGDHKFFVGYYCKFITGLPLVVTIRAYELHNNPNPALFRQALAACDLIVTISVYNRQLLIERFGAPAARIEIVRQIVDLAAFCAKPTIKILIVGFFSEKKGHDVLFQALKTMQRPDVELWVVGDEAPDRNVIDCRRLARTLGLDQQIAFFGQQSGSALRALYRECDIFCLPSRTDSTGDKEGFPNAIIEAMAFSKPVVSTYHAGIPEVVDAVLVEENNVEQLAAALQQLCDAVEVRRQLGDRNRAIAERLFSPANNDRLEALLYQQTQKRRSNTPLYSAPLPYRENIDIESGTYGSNR
ncbi:MAG: colanic acid biosynthesis glycosyltransferase WcaL [Caldilinea sp. CFX5]|nr:colanic acid biosynthesis glycosyltransferase WcaL [Caldilinea sp. CFX5]